MSCIAGQDWERPGLRTSMAWILRILFFHSRSKELKTSSMILPFTYLCSNPPASLSQSFSFLRPGFLSALFLWYWWCWPCSPPSWHNSKSWCRHPSTPACMRSASDICTGSYWRKDQSRRGEEEAVNSVSTLQRQGQGGWPVTKDILSLKGKWTLKALLSFTLGLTPPVIDGALGGQN